MNQKSHSTLAHLLDVVHKISNIKFTKREMDIISCVIHGRSSKGIAAKLSISPRTVEAHLYSAMNKAGISSRDGIITFFEKHQLLDLARSHYQEISGEKLTQGYPSKSIEMAKIKAPVLRETKKRWFALAAVFLCASLAMLPYLKLPNKDLEQTLIQSDLLIPKPFIILERSMVIKEIDQAHSSRSGISTIALVGIGGAGKTTLARQYAKRKGSALTWEINAESNDSLLISFEDLAFHLASTSEQMQEFKNITSIDDPERKAHRILAFTKSSLKRVRNWTLIFDNVEKLGILNRYIPTDEEVWGTGTVLITTRNQNIDNHKYIQISGIVRVGELDKTEARELFSKIYFEGKRKDFIPDEEILTAEFLENIPPYPLDISTAAYFLRQSSLKSDEYMALLKDRKTYFSNAQEELLNDIGDYEKTRYIITKLAVDQILADNDDNSKLLFALSTLDSQDIPVEIFEKIIDKKMVDQFLNKLQGSSLITLWIDKESKFISIHRSLQEAIYMCCLERLNASELEDHLRDTQVQLCSIIEEQIEKMDLIRLRKYVIHAEKFIDKLPKTNNLTFADLAKAIGMAKNILGDYKEGEKWCNKAYHSFKNHPGDQRKQLQLLLLHLGYSTRSSGEYERSIKYQKAGLELSTELYGKDSLITAKSLAELGNSYLVSGKFNEAIHYGRSATEIFYNRHGHDHMTTAWSERNLGRTYRQAGYCKLSINLLLKSLKTFEKHRGENHVDTIWSTAPLGHAYLQNGEYQKAIDILERVYKDRVEIHGLDHRRTAWISVNLGLAYTYSGNLKKAKPLLDQALTVFDNSPEESLATNGLGFWCEKNKQYGEAISFYKRTHDSAAKYFGRSHPIAIEALIGLARIAKKLKNLINAEKYLEQAKEYCIETECTHIFLVYEELANLYLEKARIEELDTLKDKTIESIKKALDVLYKHYPENSPHILRLEKILITLNSV